MNRLALDTPLVSLTVRPLPQMWLDLSPFGYSDAFRDVMRGIPGANWNPGTKSYRLPEEAWPCLERVLRAKIAEVERDERKPYKTYDCPVVDLGIPIRDYQIEGAKFLYDRVRHCGSALLGDDPGLGKTVQLIYFARAIESDSLLIVAPAVVLRHWEAELKKWWPAMCTAVVDSRKALERMKETRRGIEKDWNNISFIMSYDFLRSNAEAIAEVIPITSGLVLDEIHYIQSAKAARSKAVASLVARARKQKSWVVGLSGTPMTARPRDLHHPLDVLFPARFGRFLPFAIRYCDGHQEEVMRDKNVWITDGASNTEELGKRLQHLMIRRSRLDVLKDLPERNRIVIPVEPPRSKLKKLAEITLSKGDSRSMQKALQLIEKFKIEAAVDLATELTEQGSKVLIYTMTRSHAATIADAFEVEAVDGTMAPDKRKPALIRSSEKASVGVATVYSVTTGIDLTFFDSIIFVGLDWVPANLLQAEARCHRLGQIRNVNIYYLVAMGTVDEAIRERVIWRLDTFSEILGGAEEQKRMRKDLRQYSEEQLLDQIVEMVMKGSTNA